MEPSTPTIRDSDNFWPEIVMRRMLRDAQAPPQHCDAPPRPRRPPRVAPPVVRPMPSLELDPEPAVAAPLPRK